MQAINDITEAVSLLKKTLPEMQRRNIATTPENYAIWYEFVAGANAALVDEIKLLDANKTPFTSVVHSELYQKHIASEHQSVVNQLSDNVKEVINSFLMQSKHEGEGLGQYSRTLKDLSLEAETTQNIGELKGMVSQLIEHTKQREVATNVMQESLSSMSKEMQQLKDEVARLSGEKSVDPLTRVPTRSIFDDDLDSHVTMALSEQEPLSLILLEVDKFAEVRKKFGNVIGDKVLKFIATLFKKHLKGSDLIARYDEHCFAMLLPETGAKGAAAAAENLCAKIAKQTLSDSAEKLQLGTMTVSGGVTSLKESDTPQTLTQRAEACLSAARGTGGNRVKVA